MPPSYSIWSTTTIIVVGNLNIVRGTTITNTDSFNVVESTVTRQSLSNTPLGKFIIGLEASSIDLWLAPTVPVTPNHPVDVAESAQSTVSNSNILNISCHAYNLRHTVGGDFTSWWRPFFSASSVVLSPRQSKSDERTTNGIHSPIKMNKFKHVYRKIKDQLKRGFNYFPAQHE